MVADHGGDVGLDFGLQTQGGQGCLCALQANLGGDPGKLAHLSIRRKIDDCNQEPKAGTLSRTFCKTNVGLTLQRKVGLVSREQG